jgi:hypothetical protein
MCSLCGMGGQLLCRRRPRGTSLYLILLHLSLLHYFRDPSSLLVGGMGDDFAFPSLPDPQPLSVQASEW